MIDFKNQCIEIYNKAFGEDASFTERLFNICKANCRYVLEGETVVSICFLLPCEIVKGNEKQDFYYIFAVATREEFRGKGYMRKLFESVENETDLPLILRPANENLVALYSKFGFEKITANALDRGICELLPKDEFEILAKDSAEEEKEPFTVMIKGCEAEKFENLYFPFSMF